MCVADSLKRVDQPVTKNRLQWQAQARNHWLKATGLWLPFRFRSGLKCVRATLGHARSTTSANGWAMGPLSERWRSIPTLRCCWRTWVPRRSWTVLKRRLLTGRGVTLRRGKFWWRLFFFQFEVLATAPSNNVSQNVVFPPKIRRNTYYTIIIDCLRSRTGRKLQKTVIQKNMLLFLMVSISFL